MSLVTQSHKDLHRREFGSALLNVAHLRNWLDMRGLAVNAAINGDFIQVELLLCAIEAARHFELTDAEAAEIMAANPPRVERFAREVGSDGLGQEAVGILSGVNLPARWLCAAEAHLQWRNLIRNAVNAGDLTLLDCDSKLPIVRGAVFVADQIGSESGKGKAEECESAGDSQVKDWKELARQIADELFDHDTNADPSVRDCLIRTGNRGEVTGGYAVRVMEVMRKRKIHGPRGLITNANTISRDALQGAKWWARKSK